MRFGILGPVEIATDNGLVSMGQPRHRALLAYLLLRANRVITPGQVAEALWGGAEPATAKSQVHVGVSTLRSVLRTAGIPDVIATRPGGYQLTLAKGDLDVDVFGQRVGAAKQAATAGRYADSAHLLREGLGMWRGEALAGINAAFVPAARQRLDEQRLSALEWLADAELAMGHHDIVIAMLDGVIGDFPLRERMVGQLMLALHHCGRGADAMATFERLRAHLAREYGTDPSRELQQLHVDLLRGGRATGSPVRDVRPTPRQLPARIANFCGRGHQLALLNKLIDDSQPAAVPIMAIAGTAGVGKTDTEL